MTMKKRQQPIKFHPSVESGLRDILDMRKRLGVKGGYSTLVEELASAYVMYVKEKFDDLGEDIDRDKALDIMINYKIGL